MLGKVNSCFRAAVVSGAFERKKLLVIYTIINPRPTTIMHSASSECSSCLLIPIAFNNFFYTSTEKFVVNFNYLLLRTRK